MSNRKDVSTLTSASLVKLRSLLDQYIARPADNPVAEHKAAGMDMSLMIHDGAGGQMPNPETSPSDPIFWPFHAFLLSVYERWRTL